MSQSNGIYEPFDFDDLQPIEIPVKYRKKKYMLCEASESGAKAYRNLQMKSLKFGDNGKPNGVIGGAEIQTLLLSHCVREVGEDGKLLNYVSQAVLDSWQPKVIKALFEKAKEISELEDKEDKATLIKRLQETQEKIRVFDLAEREAKQNLKNVQPSTATTFD